MLIFLSMLESDEERRLFTDLYNQYGNMMLHVAKRYFPKDIIDGFLEGNELQKMAASVLQVD